jgi:predicted membrane-bound spermidine synthase
MLHLVIALISYFSKYLPQIGSECGYQVVLGIIMIFSGAITGIFFPIANRIYIDHGGIEALSAGRTDSLDHLGAAFGSIFTGCFFFPLLGLSDTFNFIACLALMSASIFLLNYIITD